MQNFNFPSGGPETEEQAKPSKSSRAKAVSETPQTSDDRSRGTLTKQDIARAVYSSCPGLSRHRAKTLVDAVLEEIVSALTLEEKVSLREFGTFSVLQKRERPGRNPKTGAVAPITARRVVVLRASANMKAKVDGE